MKLLQNLLIYFFLSVGTGILWAQPQADMDPMDDWHFEVVELPGMGPNLNIESIVQDSTGYMWIATGRGLVRYDGHRTKVYSHDPMDPNSISSDDVSWLHLDRQGDLWAGTYDHGLNRLDLETGLFTRYLFEESVITLTEDHHGIIWAGSSSGLYQIDPGSHSIRHHFSGNPVWSVHIDAAGDLWVGTGPVFEVHFLKALRGLYHYLPEQDSFVLYEHQLSTYQRLKQYPVSAILEDDRRQLWVGTSSGGLNQVNKNTEKLSYFPISSAAQRDKPPFITHLFEDLDRKLWISASDHGLYYYDPWTIEQIHFKKVGDKSILSSYGVWRMHQSRDSVYWVGTGRAGKKLIKFYRKHQPIRYHPLKGFNFSSILEDTITGQLWIGTNRGLLRYDWEKGIQKHYQHEPSHPGSLPSNDVLGILQDHLGNLWLRFAPVDSAGLCRFDPVSERFTTFQHDPNNPESLSNNLVTDLLEDKRGRLWIATWGGGLNRFDPRKERFIHYRHQEEAPNSLAHDNVYELFEDDDGILWIIMNYHQRVRTSSTEYQTSLNRFDPIHEIFTLVDIPSWIFKDICQDRAGNLWMTIISGLIQLDPHTLDSKVFNTDNSTLPANDLHHLITDQNGQLVINGINEIRGFSPEIQKATYHINIREELAGREGMFSANNMMLMKDGTILLPTHNSGFGFFNPDDIISSAPNELKIVDFWILNQSSNPTYQPNRPEFDLSDPNKTLTLLPTENSFAFSIFIPDYRDPAAHRFEYMLENYDDSWWQSTGIPEAIYHRVPPGDYVLHARLIGHPGEPTSVRIKILAPWWQTWPAIIFFGLAVLSLLFALYRFLLNRRMQLAEAHRLRELDQVKTKLYTNITHEFRTPLTIISGMTEKVRENPKKRLTEGLDMIKRNSDKLLNLVSQLLDLRKMESGHMAVQFQQGDIMAFLRFLFDSFHSYAADKGLRLHFISKLDSFTMDFDPDKTLKIVSNLLSNAIKFTKENGDVYLSVSGQVSQSMNGQGKHSEMLEIQVKDTGIGISESQLPHVFDRFYQADDRPARQAEGTGIGLALTRELVKLLNGAITVKSRLGEGATFTVQLQVTRQAPPMETPSSIGEQISGFMADRHSRAPEATTGLGIEKDIPLLLIVEDNEDVVHYLRACLEKDYRLEVARNGREGIDKALEIIPDLIISDIMMPEVDGYTLCQTLKEDGRSNHIPIILLTAKADHVSKITGLQKGADAYLAKPFNREELLVRLQQLIELRRKLQTKYDSGNFTVEAATQQEDEFVVKFRQLILERLEDDGFGIPQLSRALGINRGHLHRKIKALTGKTAAHFIRHIRLQEARQLLLNSDLNISEIAYAVGFKDPAYFSRVFTETFEESPSAVRRK